MPYFVYKIVPPSSLTHLETHDQYREARVLVRRLRREHPTEGTRSYRMAFANTRAEAEKLLSTRRDERVVGED